MLLYVLVWATILAPHMAAAQVGGVTIRPEDGSPSRCINGKTDEVWMTLRRLVTTKTQHWFTKNTSVAVVVNATVRAVSASAGSTAPKPISFPLITESSFADAPAGQVSVPLEYTLVDSLKLVQEKTRFSGVSIDLTLLNKNSATAWGTALSTLSAVAKKLPIPANPYTAAGTYLLDLANTSVANDINKQSTGDAPKTATIDLKFDPTGGCAGNGDFQRTGTIAILMDTGSAGYISAQSANSYCWSADLQPIFVLKAGKKKSGGSCSDSTGHEPYSEVTNNYVAFVLSALPASSDLAGPPAAEVQSARARCTANGLSPKACGVR